MGRQKITIGPNDFLAWGKLVKTWATGRNYVDHQMTEAKPVPTADELAPNFPKPRSFGEFWDQCGRAGVGLVFDDGKNTPVDRDDGIGLIVIQADADAYVLRLPPEERLATTGTWPRDQRPLVPGGGDAGNLSVHQGPATRHGPFGKKTEIRLVW